MESCNPLLASSVLLIRSDLLVCSIARRNLFAVEPELNYLCCCPRRPTVLSDEVKDWQNDLSSLVEVTAAPAAPRLDPNKLRRSDRSKEDNGFESDLTDLKTKV